MRLEVPWEIIIVPKQISSKMSSRELLNFIKLQRGWVGRNKNYNLLKFHRHFTRNLNENYLKFPEDSSKLSQIILIILLIISLTFPNFIQFFSNFPNIFEKFSPKFLYNPFKIFVSRRQNWLKLICHIMIKNWRRPEPQFFSPWPGACKMYIVLAICGGTKVIARAPKKKMGIKEKTGTLKKKLERIHYPMCKKKPSCDEEPAYPLTYPFVTHLWFT